LKSFRRYVDWIGKLGELQSQSRAEPTLHGQGSQGQELAVSVAHDMSG